MPNHREFLHRTWLRCSMTYPPEPRPLGDSPVPQLAIEDAVADPARCDMAVSDTGGQSCGDAASCPAAWHPATVGHHALMALLPTPDRAAFFDTAPARRPRSSPYITNAYLGRYARRTGRFAALWTIARIPVPRRATHARLCVECYRSDPDSPMPPIGELMDPGLPETVIRRRLVGMTDAPESPDTANYLLELRR